MQEIVPAIGEAHDELLSLRRKVAQLEVLIARARDYIDPTGYWVPWPPLPTLTRPPTLHAAMVNVLRRRRNEPITVGDLTREIAKRGLYCRRDGLPPTVNDVSARISSYPALFKRDGWTVALRLMLPPYP